MLRYIKFLLVMLICAAFAPGAHAQLRSATDRAAQIHWYQKSLSERATQEARELSRLLNLNESEMQLVRQFATARLQAENEAQAYITTDAVARREAQNRAAAQFQTRLVNVLNESQMQRYFQLLAETSTENSTDSPAPTITSVVPPATQPMTPAGAGTAPAQLGKAPAAKKPVRRYAPIGTYHSRAARRP